MVLEQHREAQATEFKTSFGLLDSKLDQTRITLEDHAQCVSSLELAAEDLSRRVLDLESICATLRDDNARLKLPTWRVEADVKTYASWVYQNPPKVDVPLNFSLKFTPQSIEYWLIAP